MTRTWFALPLLALAPMATMAQAPGAEQAPPMATAQHYVPGGFGSQTNVWLQMQLLPGYTDNDPRPIPGEVASRTYARYLKSFTYPIPAEFNRESFSSSGNGSGSGSSTSSSSSSNGGSSTTTTSGY